MSGIDDATAASLALSANDTPRMVAMRRVVLALTVALIVSPAAFAWWWALAGATWRHAAAGVASWFSLALLIAGLNMALDAARKYQAGDR